MAFVALATLPDGSSETLGVVPPLQADDASAAFS
jgi:hypothetical protein